MGVVAAVLAGTAVLALAGAVGRRRERLAERLLGGWGARPRARRAGGGREALAAIGRAVGGGRAADRSRLERRLRLAGDPLSVEAMVGLKWVAGGVVAVAGLGAALAGAPVLPLVPVGVALGVRGPEVVLARMGRRRQERIAAHVGDLVEVLVATAEAGLSPPMGFRRSVEVVRGPLREELGAVLREMDLGVPWREALDRLAARTDVSALRRVVAALGRSQRLGAGIGPTLRTVAQDVRLERQARAEEAARRAPVKMLFPLVFLVLPAFLLLTVGPVVLATIRSLH